MAERDAHYARFGTLEAEVAAKMVRQFRTFDASRGLLPIEAESLAYMALEFLEENGLLGEVPAESDWLTCPSCGITWLRHGKRFPHYDDCTATPEPGAP